MDLQYQYGDPTENGVYACRVDHPFMSGLMEDIFLMWYDGQWTYLGSDQRFRGEVWWIGPLPRKISQCPAYIYARGYAGGKYTESTSDLDFLLTLEAGSKMGIYQLSPGGETKKLYTAFNGRWMKLK